MKILIGICGIGNGHLSRQTNVIKLLKQNNNEIVIATTNNNMGYFEENVPDLKVLEINIPWIACNEKGIDFETSINKYNEANIDQFYNFLNFAINVEKSFSGVPALVITDYEPNVAQYSYAVDIPLICMEQQSKFLYLDEIEISNYSILEEKKRINYFFPIDIKAKKVKIVPPIISLENIEFKNYSTEFKNDLENSFCLISTAGHQLLSGAISIGIPVYLIPLSTYEQNLMLK
ncbi:MAG: glycosyltransferase family protein [Bacilli bacterium]